MTKKLYYDDAYIRDFSAEVLSCEQRGELYYVVLDSTAFFPEEGGQTADHGRIGGARVLDAREEDGVIYHVTDAPLEVGQRVDCAIDFDERFMKMQCHTAEHILCGIIHRLYGLENVGFHLGGTAVTFDVGGILTRAELDRVEDLANAAVFANLPVTASFPTRAELADMTFRSKMDVIDGMRIVTIGDVDSCACCAPHVSRTGEIGMIKMLDFVKHKGGLRIQMVAGVRALADYRSKYTNVQSASAHLSEPQESVGDAVGRAVACIEEYKSKIKYQGLRIAALMAGELEVTAENSVRLLDGMSIDQLREFCNSGVSRVGGILVALSGVDGDYKYVIVSRTVDLSRVARDINSALGGKGGGNAAMIQGSLRASLDDIRRYFKV